MRYRSRNMQYIFTSAVNHGGPLSLAHSWARRLNYITCRTSFPRSQGLLIFTVVGWLERLQRLQSSPLLSTPAVEIPFYFFWPVWPTEKTITLFFLTLSLVPKLSLSLFLPLCRPLLLYVCVCAMNHKKTMLKRCHSLRLSAARGTVQLDKSFSDGIPPHHIPESLSELTLAVYLARRLPLQVR